jgi:2-keto-4-pentenoate hydratase/2-oxohepta-3-ene-1,7-dioic acid hydratase in catechol pathway
VRCNIRTMHYQLRNPDGSHSVWQTQKIVCVAKNYSEHAAEMKAAVPGKPTFFLKPNTSLCDFSGPLVTPRDRGALHHEIELGLVIGKRLSRADRIPKDAVAGYVLALDLTLRDLQTELRQQGYPWDASKGFANACPVTPLLGTDLIPDPANVELSFSVNGTLRQSGNTAQMVYKIPRLLADAAEIFVLEPGDILLTGTPVGVGPLEPGDQYVGGINGREFAGKLSA